MERLGESGRSIYVAPPPAATVFADSYKVVAGRGLQNVIHTNQWVQSSNNEGHWLGWSPGDGAAISGPAVISWGGSHMETLAIRADNHLWGKTFGPMGNTAWEDLGGNFAGNPTASSWGYQQLEVAIRDTSGNIMQRFKTPDGWTPNWANQVRHPNAAASQPSIASLGKDIQDVFYRGADNRLY